MNPRRRPRPMLVLGFVAVMVALWVAYDLPDPTSSRALRDAEERLRQYYRENPLPRDWRVAAVDVHGFEVWADLAFPPDVAEVFARGPAVVLDDALGARCPPESDLAWRFLRSRHDIQVRGLAPDGRALAAVSCRAVNQ